MHADIVLDTDQVKLFQDWFLEQEQQPSCCLLNFVSPDQLHGNGSMNYSHNCDLRGNVLISIMYASLENVILHALYSVDISHSDIYKSVIVQ